jgi:hypothetical protein
MNGYWWQVMHSNHRRLSRRFMSSPAESTVHCSNRLLELGLRRLTFAADSSGAGRLVEPVPVALVRRIVRPAASLTSPPPDVMITMPLACQIERRFAVPSGPMQSRGNAV